MVIGDKENVVNIHSCPQEDAPIDIGVEAGVDFRTLEAPCDEKGGKEHGPFTTRLLEAIETTMELAHKAVPLGIENGDTRWWMHVQVGVKLGVDVRLADVNLVEVVIVKGRNDEEEAKSGGLDYSGKDTVEINTMALSVTIGDETCLEFFNATIGIALHGEDVVAMHDVGTIWNGGQPHHLPCVVLDEASELASNGVTPIGGVWRRKRSAVAFGDGDLAHVGGEGDGIGGEEKVGIVDGAN